MKLRFAATKKPVPDGTHAIRITGEVIEVRLFRARTWHKIEPVLEVVIPDTPLNVAPIAPVNAILTVKE